MLGCLGAVASSSMHGFLLQPAVLRDFATGRTACLRNPSCAYYSYLPKTRPHWSHSPCHCFVESLVFSHDFANKAFQLSSAHTRPRPLFGIERSLRPQPLISRLESLNIVSLKVFRKTLSVSRRVASTYSKVADFVSRESLGYNGLETVTCYPGRYQPVRFFFQLDFATALHFGAYGSFGGEWPLDQWEQRV